MSYIFDFLISEPLTESLKLKGVIKTFDLDTGLGTILDTSKNTRPFVQKGSDFKPGQFVTFDLNGEDVSNVFLENETNEENQRKYERAIEKNRASAEKRAYGRAWGIEEGSWRVYPKKS